MIFSISVCWAETPDSAQNKSTEFVLWKDIKSAGCDATQLVSCFPNITPTQWYISVGVVGGVTTLVATNSITGFDQHFRNVALRSQTSVSQEIFSVANEYGHTFTGAAIGGGLYFSGVVLGDESIRTTGRLVFESLIVAGIATTVLKGVIGRARPYTYMGDASYNPFSFSNDYYALPSGHATVAFAVSSVLSERIGNIYVSVGLYALASSAAMGRMYFDKHWMTDVLLGGFIGTVSGIAVTRAEKRCKADCGCSEPTVMMYPTFNGFGITCNW